MNIRLSVIAILALAFSECSFSQSSPSKETIARSARVNDTSGGISKVPDSVLANRSEAEWKKVLAQDVYYVARQKGTERPWTSKYENFKEIGTYYCAVCGNALFRSDTKFDSGCGWPSFYEPTAKESIVYLPDHALGMERTEVQCGRCKSHLGHVFDDGPPPTGKRYCINGVVLDFQKAKQAEEKYKGGKKG